MNDKRLGSVIAGLLLLSCGSGGETTMDGSGDTTVPDAGTTAVADASATDDAGGSSTPGVDGGTSLTDGGGGGTDSSDDGAATQPVVDASVDPSNPVERWIGAWGTAPFGPAPLGILGDGAFGLGSLVAVGGFNANFPGNVADNRSFRMIVHPTIGGERVRVRLSNLLGDRPVTFKSVHVAKRRSGAAIDAATDVAVTFGGAAEVTIAPGDEVASDGVDFAYAFGDDLAISFHVDESGPMTFHEVSFVTNYVSDVNSGDVTSDASGDAFKQRSLAWYFLTGLDVDSPTAKGTVVALGDSITDGTFGGLDNAARWTDVLARRLNDANIPLGVVNVGINGNIVGHASQGGVGEGAVQRFGRDVLGRAGVRTVLIFEGTNDLGGDRKAIDVYDDLRTMIDEAHASGVCVVLATLIQRGLWGAWSTAREAERVALNELIRETKDVEGIVDFDAALGPVLPLVTYVPDGVHPLAAGFEKMGNAVPLDALVSEGKSCKK